MGRLSLASNSPSSCPSFPSTELAGVLHHTLLIHIKSNIIEHRANRNRAPEKEMYSCLTNPMSTECFIFGMWHFCKFLKLFSVTYSYWEKNSKIHKACFLYIRFFQRRGLVIGSSWLYLSTLVLLWLCHFVWYTTLSCRSSCHGLLASEAFWDPFTLASVLLQGSHLWPRVCYRIPTSWSSALSQVHIWYMISETFIFLGLSSWAHLFQLLEPPISFL